MRKPLKRLIRKRFVVIPRHEEKAPYPVAADGHIRDTAVEILRQLKHEQKIGNGGQVVPRGGLRAKSLRIRFADKAGFRRIPAGCITVFRLGPELREHARILFVEKPTRTARAQDDLRRGNELFIESVTELVESEIFSIDENLRPGDRRCEMVRVRARFRGGAEQLEGKGVTQAGRIGIAAEKV